MNALAELLMPVAGSAKYNHSTLYPVRHLLPVVYDIWTPPTYG